MEDKEVEKIDVTVMINEGSSVSELANKLRSLGLEQVKEMPHILCLTGRWPGELATIKEIPGVFDAEIQTDTHHPN